MPDISWPNHQLQFSMNNRLNPDNQQRSDAICQLFSSMDLNQWMPEHPDKGYTLDLIFTQHRLLEIADQQDQLAPCDPHHKVFFGELKVLNGSKFPSESRVEYDFRSADYDEIRVRMDVIG
ncbi:hypothetical protein QAD02_003443 [Eretmocerus hayati]|uniref:Uncharacterized protein n=1 Tax=Eretmocerus hayati TaxID=131215 RepID=A0ACC2NPE9_9HYME|nr:hypothetical protein QAD02_003443 [Eretmocerus hayati]